MNIRSVFDPEFSKYGAVVKGVDFTPITEKLKGCICPDNSVYYVPSWSALEDTAVAQQIKDNFFGGMDIQIGVCSGQNDELNCLEYHRSEELNIYATDAVVLLAKRDEMIDWHISSEKVVAFYIPAGAAAVFYSSTLHFAPCNANPSDHFTVAVVLQKGTNEEKPAIIAQSDEDRLLWGKNKWLVAHPDAPEAKRGAFVGIDGKNVNIRG